MGWRSRRPRWGSSVRALAEEAGGPREPVEGNSAQRRVAHRGQKGAAPQLRWYAVTLPLQRCIRMWQTSQPHDLYATTDLAPSHSDDDLGMEGA